MDFQAEFKLFSTTNNVFLDVRKALFCHCVLPLTFVAFHLMSRCWQLDWQQWLETVKQTYISFTQAQQFCVVARYICIMKA